MGVHDQPRGLQGPSAFPERQPSEPPSGSVLAAAFRSENLVTNMLRGSGGSAAFLSSEEYAARFGSPPAPDFDPWPLIEGTDFERHSQILGAARSQLELEEMKRYLKQLEEDKKILAGSGARGACPIHPLPSAVCWAV